MSLRFLLTRNFFGMTLAVAPLTAMTITNTASAAIPAPTVPLKLMTVAVQGNHHVATADILQAFGYHAGDIVTRNDLIEGQKRVSALYSARNVGAELAEQMRIAGKGISVKLVLEEQADAAPAGPVALVLDKVEFQGNRKVSTEALEAATKLRAGGPVSNDLLAGDQRAIQALYQAKKVSGSIQPQVTYPNHDQHVVLIWDVHEQESKKAD
ncbi:POTRA domain-containing protein [Gluconobacter kanchanaburiensis]|uniref:POTRA domain-containing protein n=1 Tax=Gluconobacter kanchanaburiensis NBRC 103587 TaxID=1307948 RepID=A0A511B9T3_9PROT|nr:POTRA domain-containing protein [Gluconobacter kanchanaburiensis]MBF0862876.1 hypothetical protein [Gluconobacter kanchanaburiensis]GBR71996.1 surface antigen protein [Gluconobacter kanchanaburiensis NBRC 103587]GEK97199.1 hypothetical protein GKA01_23960 [Gluconobacter kanchanaburiensis NBRC 103587]